MAKKLKEIETELLALPEDVREHLLAVLARSVPAGREPLSREWTEEIERRSAQIDRGEVELIPDQDVYARVRARLG